MMYLVIDLEMGEVSPKDRESLGGIAKEIIQIGAVLLNEAFSITREFNAYVRPRLGYVSRYVQKMTGITNGMLRHAPDIREVLSEFVEWLPDEELVAMSWSDSDQRQLIAEMRVKEIFKEKIDALFPGWVDFQTDFGRMIGLRERCSLAEALRISHVHPEGREHDGLCDARNTALLLSKLMKSKKAKLLLTPIRSDHRNNASSVKKSKWTFDRALFALRYGKEAALGDSYQKHRFERCMHKQ